MSSTSFVLEGGGWYVTDYGYRKGVKDEKKDSSSDSSPAAKASDNTSTAGSTAGSASSGTGEARPCAKSDDKPAASATKAE